MRSIYLLDGGEDEHPDDDSEVEISLHAMSSASTKDTMRLPVSVQDQGFNTLVDSSFTHCFMAANVARRLNLIPTTKDNMTVGVANGKTTLPSALLCAILLHQRRAVLHQLPHHCLGGLRDGARVQLVVHP
jgi:hypothetical protein